MGYKLSLTAAKFPQFQKEMTLDEGDLVVGRDIDCDWVIDDPELYVSRRHCVISKSGGGYIVTDSSKGGLFVNGAEKPLGYGNTAVLRDGMTLELGNYEITVLNDTSVPRTDPVATPERRLAEEPGNDRRAEPAEAEKRRAVPADAESVNSTPVHPAEAGGSLKLSKGALFPDAPTAGSAHAGPTTGEEGEAEDGRLYPPEPPELVIKKTARAEPQRETREEVRTESEAAKLAQRTDAPGDPTLLAAFFRGMGLSADNLRAEDPARQMEELGDIFRSLVDGLVFLLRARRQQKSLLPVPMTQFGNNPLKIFPNTDRALRALVRHEGEGFLEPRQAIDQAFRDVARHNLSTWSGLEAALRKLIADIDPAAFEAELKTSTALEVLAAGGRNAKLWKLYTARYKEIARSAEDRFLGTVSSEFARIYNDVGEREQ